MTQLSEVSQQGTRQLEQELLNKIQLAQQDPLSQALGKLLELRISKCQDRMLECQQNEFLAIQTEAKVMSKLLKELRPKSR